MIELSKDEHVVCEIRRHWYVLLVESFFLALLFLVPWVVFFGLDTSGFSFSGGEGSLFFFASAAWLFFIWIAFMIIWTNYYLDVWIVTSKRILDIEQHGLFSRDMSEFRLDRIQDVTIEVKGILPTLLRFGDIHVQTAGEAREFIIKSIPRPYRVRDIIIREHDRAVVESHSRGGH